MCVAKRLTSASAHLMNCAWPQSAHFLQLRPPQSGSRLPAHLVSRFMSRPTRALSLRSRAGPRRTRPARLRVGRGPQCSHFARNLARGGRKKGDRRWTLFWYTLYTVHSFDQYTRRPAGRPPDWPLGPSVPMHERVSALAYYSRAGSRPGERKATQWAAFSDLFWLPLAHTHTHSHCKGNLAGLMCQCPTCAETGGGEREFLHTQTLCIVGSHTALASGCLKNQFDQRTKKLILMTTTKILLDQNG